MDRIRSGTLIDKSHLRYSRYLDAWEMLRSGRLSPAESIAARECVLRVHVRACKESHT